jgi:hypothetical protein
MFKKYMICIIIYVFKGPGASHTLETSLRSPMYYTSYGLPTAWEPRLRAREKWRIEIFVKNNHKLRYNSQTIHTYIYIHNTSRILYGYNVFETLLSIYLRVHTSIMIFLICLDIFRLYIYKYIVYIFTIDKSSINVCSTRAYICKRLKVLRRHNVLISHIVHI